PARRRAATPGADPALPGRGALRVGRDDPRYHGRVADGVADPAPHAGPRLGPVPHRELRRTAGGGTDRWGRRDPDRRPDDPVDRGRRRRARSGLAAALPHPRDADPPRTSGVTLSGGAGGWPAWGPPTGPAPGRGTGPSSPGPRGRGHDSGT